MRRLNLKFAIKKWRKMFILLKGERLKPRLPAHFRWSCFQYKIKFTSKSTSSKFTQHYETVYRIVSKPLSLENLETVFAEISKQFQQKHDYNNNKVNKWKNCQQLLEYFKAKISTSFVSIYKRGKSQFLDKNCPKSMPSVT